jgi:sensor c-di-GMP phosphodiesterase-like protein
MAEGIGVSVVAEGVETNRQADFLRGKHCHEVQGFLFSQPLSAHQVEDFLRGKVAPMAAGAGKTAQRMEDSRIRGVEGSSEI